MARSAEVGVHAMGARIGSTDTEAEAEARSSPAASDAVSEARVGVRGRVELTRAQASRARGRTQAGPWQRCPFPCHAPCVPHAAVPSVARTDRTRTTPIRTWRRQGRLARLRPPARAARRGPARRLPPARSDDHARRTPAAVAPRVVAGGETGQAGHSTQVSEHSAIEVEPDMNKSAAERRPSALACSCSRWSCIVLRFTIAAAKALRFGLALTGMASIGRNSSHKRQEALAEICPGNPVVLSGGRRASGVRTTTSL